MLSGQRPLRSAMTRARARARDRRLPARPGWSYELEAHDARPRCGSVSVRIPDPLAGAIADAPRAVVSRLADQEAQAATTEREFRIVADPRRACASATHFVGYIPTARHPTTSTLTTR